MASFKGNYFAKGGLDMAWWDLYARSQGRPLWQVIGGQSATIDVGADLGVMDDMEMLLGEIEKVTQAQYQAAQAQVQAGVGREYGGRGARAFPRPGDPCRL